MLIESAPSWLIRSFFAIANRWSWLGKRVNTFAINGTVNACRHRPHPWSTVHDYVSWTSLTDQRWSARHLPATSIPNLPAADRVIELFQRRNGEQRLCPKSTCLFPAFAQYLTDGFIRTRMPKGDEPETVRLQNTSNHQIDMCPLYGRTPDQTDALRLKSETPGRRGRLMTQTIRGEEYAPFLFADDGTVRAEFAVLDEPLGLNNFPDPELRSRIFAFGGDRANAAPQVAMMNTLFLREHNRLAAEIEKENPGWDDERVFQTARSTLIVLFIKIVVEEYINHISPASFRFRADPSVAWDAPWNKPNWVTTEFSLLYRWHSLVPDTITWNGQPYTVDATFMNNRLLLDAGLARAFLDMSSQRAGRLGAFNTAKPLLAVETNAIEQGRRCRLAPYTDYRHYVSLPRPADFSDISSDPQVADLLRGTYQSADEVEFYVGLFAEDQVENSPLPPLILRMVAVDAFSQALTNPLLSKAVFHAGTFSKPGWEAINNTGSLGDILHRNCPAGTAKGRISMTWDGWKP